MKIIYGTTGSPGPSCLMISSVKISRLFRIIPEFSILRLTFHSADNNSFSDLHSVYLRSLIPSTVKPVLSGHLKIDKTKVLMENGSFMNVESIAECSPWSILQYF